MNSVGAVNNSIVRGQPPGLTELDLARAALVSEDALALATSSMGDPDESMFDNIGHAMDVVATEQRHGWERAFACLAHKALDLLKDAPELSDSFVVSLGERPGHQVLDSMIRRSQVGPLVDLSTEVLQRVKAGLVSGHLAERLFTTCLYSGLEDTLLGNLINAAQYDALAEIRRSIVMAVKDRQISAESAAMALRGFKPPPGENSDTVDLRLRHRGRLTRNIAEDWLNEARSLRHDDGSLVFNVRQIQTIYALRSIDGDRSEDWPLIDPTTSLYEDDEGDIHESGFKGYADY